MANKSAGIEGAFDLEREKAEREFEFRISIQLKHDYKTWNSQQTSKKVPNIFRN
jgi:hypothetical protein